MSGPRPRRTAPLALLLPLVALWGCAAGPPARPSGPAARAPAARAAGPVDVAYPDEGHEHIPNPEFPHAPYLSNPPTSGPHTPFIAPWGIYGKPVPNEILLHNLEHGGVILGHRCTDCPEVVAGLKALAKGYPLVIIAPNPALPAPIVLSAWQHALAVERLDGPSEQAIRDFLARHHGVDHHPKGTHLHAPPPADAPAPTP
jgi:hypothetical protein